ncbi:probable chitinase 10 isoform X2 [Hermetia illucens]|nr:probable chitinase 10 isoform X2 [Hermetia illucens]
MSRGHLIYLLLNILALCARQTFGDDPCTGTNYKQNDRQKDPDDCRNYFECGVVSGVFEEKTCPYGTGFDPDTKTCRWRDSIADNAVCFGSTGPSITCTAPLPVVDVLRKQCVPEGTYVTEANAIRPDCSIEDADGKPKYEGKFVADPKNCAGYYICKDGARLKGSCDEKLYNFDPLNQYCTKKENLPCSVEGGDTSTSACEGKAAGTFVADENICTAYFRCTGDNAGRQEFCENEKYFNEGSCVSKRPSRCSCEDADESAKGEFAHEDPTKYWICEKGKRTEKTCPNGTKWSQIDESCLI